MKMGFCEKCDKEILFEEVYCLDCGIENMSNLIIFHIPFTGLGLYNGYRGDEWFKRRIELFHKYTLKSLLKQKEQDFIIWCSFRPEEKYNPLVKTIEISHKHIFTFGGIPIWDDKKENEEQGLLGRLKATLPELKEIVGNKNVKLVNVASDDMYSEEVVESIKEQPFEEGIVLTHRLGYIYSVEDRLAEWNPITHPPFHTIMYSNETFLNPQKHYDFIKECKSHELIPEIFKEIRMPDRRYCVLVHNENISTTFEHPFKGQEIYSETEKLKILNKFYK